MQFKSQAPYHTQSCFFSCSTTVCPGIYCHNSIITEFHKKFNMFIEAIRSFIVHTYLSIMISKRLATCSYLHHYTLILVCIFVYTSKSKLKQKWLQMGIFYTHPAVKNEQEIMMLFEIYWAQKYRINLCQIVGFKKVTQVCWHHSTIGVTHWLFQFSFCIVGNLQ